MALCITNSLTRKKEVFEPLAPPRVGIYVCGPTVYDHSHIGHAKSYVSFDVIVKWLRASGYDVRYVQNITDVGHLTDDADEGDDKIERRARGEDVHPLELVDIYMRSYFEDMVALGIAHPNLYVRATQHIPEQIELIRKLIERGHAYEVGGNVYFDVASWPEYGILSGRKIEDQIESGRVAARGDKRDPRDFALWKTAEGTGHILRWPSPWGWGYPGWHVECSAMSMKYLGETFDIHGGGNENKFPHHECEIAQSRAATEGGFARYWIHHNMVNVDGQKMGKSLGNSIYIKDILRRTSPEALRFFLLSAHYSRPSNFTEEALRSAEGGVARLAEAVRTLKSATGSATGGGDAALSAALDRAREAVKERMDDDFDTPGAISVLFDFVKEIHRAAPHGIGEDLAARTESFLQETAGGSLLGILASTDEATETAAAAEFIDLLVDLRNRLRRKNDWELTDQIRDRLAALGIRIQDGPDGSTWTTER